jgi:ketosteroid isomerase-like protein
MPDRATAIHVEDDRARIAACTAELLTAVNASDADRVLALWTEDGVLMPPHHAALHGHGALLEYFLRLFSRSRFFFTFTSSEIQLAGDLAIERVTYTALAWTGQAAIPVEDAGKGLHVYARQPNGASKLTSDIWNSDRPV